MRRIARTLTLAITIALVPASSALADPPRPTMTAHWYVAPGTYRVLYIENHTASRWQVERAAATWSAQLAPAGAHITLRPVRSCPRILLGVASCVKVDQQSKSITAGPRETLGGSTLRLVTRGVISWARVTMYDNTQTARLSDAQRCTMVMHEFGHVLGLDHTSADDLMNPIGGAVRGPSRADVAAVAAVYR